MGKFRASNISARNFAINIFYNYKGFGTFLPMSKRARTSARPIDKDLIVVNQAVTTTQVVTTLKTTTFPCTIVGIRWDLSVLSIIGTGNSVTAWAIVVVRDGDAAQTLALSNGASFYEPEESCLAFGLTHVVDNDIGGGPNSFHFSGSTKTMRKLKGGDLVQLISLSSVAVSSELDGVVQYFCKS